MFLFRATSLRNVQFAFLSQAVLSLRIKFNVVFNRKVSSGWLYFRNSYVKGLSLSLDRAADEQWSKHKRGQFSCPGDQDGSDSNRDFWKNELWLSTDQSARSALVQVCFTVGPQKTECPQLWFGYNSLQICWHVVYNFSLPNKHPQLNPSFNFWGFCFVGIWKSLCIHLWHWSSWYPS